MLKLLQAYKANPTDKACLRAYAYYNKHVMSACLLDEEYGNVLTQVIEHYRRIS